LASSYQTVVVQLFQSLPELFKFNLFTITNNYFEIWRPKSIDSNR